MERIVKERDRLLQRTARLLGLASTLIAALCVVLPGAVDGALLVLLLPLFLLHGLAHYRIGVNGGTGWIALVVVTGMLLIGILHLASLGSLTSVTRVAPSPTGLSEAAEIAIRYLGAGSISAIAVVLIVSLGRMIALAGALSATLISTVLALAATDTLSATFAVVLAGWAIAIAVGSLLNAGVMRAARRISNMGRAHRVERQASETEAQRRQGARLLHDTVLATLTLLAHSGVGVGAGALRQQAADDARLLRQLRLGTTPMPMSSGQYNLQQPVAQSVLGNTLESVKQRFGRMGLEVSWHGTGQVLLPSEVLDAFLLSLAECLENVRRHAGVAEAHVTITDDDTTVRAMVTDAGVGFDLAAVDSRKFGFKESVVARLKDVGGNVRLFSAPGSGTTVVLEVPK